MFSCQYCEIFKNRFFIEHLRWLPMVELELSLWNQHNFSFYISWTPSTLWQNSCKRQYPQKYICGGAHSYCNFRTFKLKQNQFAVICTRSYDMQWHVLNRIRFSAFTEWVVLWNCFMNYLSVKNTSISTGNYMFKVNSRNNRTRCEICSKLTIKIPERRHWRRIITV